jgi:hypothetical protein
MFKFVALVHSPYELNVPSKTKFDISTKKIDDAVEITIESDSFIYNPVSIVKQMLGYVNSVYADITVQYYGNPYCTDKYTPEQQKAYELFCKLYAIHSGESWESLITFFNSHYPDVGREALTEYTSERVRREVAGME